MQKKISIIISGFVLGILGVQNSFASFLDVENNHIFNEAILSAQEKNIVKGYDDETFRPSKKINRAEFTKIIINTNFDEADIYGESCFPDVKNQWFAKYICTAKREGIINGYPDGTFHPENFIAFTEASKIISLGFDMQTSSTSDIWYEPFIQLLSDQKSIPTTITRTNKEITRGDMAEIIWRVSEEIEDKEFSEYKDNLLTRNKNLENFEDDYFYDNEPFVIEEEVDSEEDCSEFEEYDAENSVCFFECNTEEECEIINDKIDASFDDLEDDYEDFSKDFSEFQGDSSELSEKAEASYRMEKGEKFILISGIETARLKKIKKWLASISPDKFSDKFLNKLIFYKKSGDGTAAFVELSPKGNKKWDMYVNMDSFIDGDKEMVFTLIHEFTHILTLNNMQLDEYNFDGCSTLDLPEGCAKKEAYIYQFYKKFWEGKFDPIAEDSDMNYLLDPTAFVTDYAATNPGEDIAESFASFVFQKKNNPKSVAEQKIQFFYNYPELTKIRTSIREVLKPFVRKRMVQ